MTLTRVLRLGMSGDDVKQMKDWLFALGFLVDKNGKPLKPTHGRFGSDTERALRSYQASHLDTKGRQLVVDGACGSLTWGALERDCKAAPVASTPVSTGLLKVADYTNISAANLALINKDFPSSAIRQSIVREILHYAYDHDKGGEIRGLYVWGANLYTPELALNIMTPEKIEKAASRTPKYFTSGRKEMMLEAIRRNPKLPGSDCSGQEVGYLRKLKLVSANFDTTANGLCGSGQSTETSSLTAGDWVGSNGHIGTYVGGGLVVEFAGGAYGCQLTKLKDRKLYSFVSKKLYTVTKWTKFRKPKYY